MIIVTSSTETQSTEKPGGTIAESRRAIAIVLIVLLLAGKSMSN